MQETYLLDSLAPSERKTGVLMICLTPYGMSVVSQAFLEGFVMAVN